MALYKINAKLLNNKVCNLIRALFNQPLGGYQMVREKKLHHQIF